MTTTYTAFCQDVDGEGTIWISPVEADSLDGAITEARNQCAADWSSDPEHIHVLGLAEGDVTILYWSDIND